jgi:hypothetical protein
MTLKTLTPAEATAASREWGCGEIGADDLFYAQNSHSERLSETALFAFIYRDGIDVRLDFGFDTLSSHGQGLAFKRWSCLCGDTAVAALVARRIVDATPKYRATLADKLADRV